MMYALTGDRQLVKADLGQGRVIQIEVQSASDPEANVSIRDVVSFSGLVDSIEGIAESMTEALRKAKPDKATVEFGVDVGVESGGLTALLVKGTGTATVKITLEWAAASA
jgi:hypothetical protein